MEKRTRCNYCGGIKTGIAEFATDHACECHRYKTTEEVVEEWKKRNPEGIKKKPFNHGDIAEMGTFKSSKVASIGLAEPLSEQIRNTIGTPEELSCLWNWFKRAQGMENKIERTIDVLAQISVRSMPQDVTNMINALLKELKPKL